MARHVARVALLLLWQNGGIVIELGMLCVIEGEIDFSISYNKGNHVWAEYRWRGVVVLPMLSFHNKCELSIGGTKVGTMVQQNDVSPFFKYMDHVRRHILEGLRRKHSLLYLFKSLKFMWFCKCSNKYVMTHDIQHMAHKDSAHMCLASLIIQV